jgi:putative addiction module component (TIGR02574 family)
MIETTWRSLGLEHLPMAEKLSIVEQLLEGLDTGEETLPVPASHLEELRRRIADSKDWPDEGSTWEEVKAEIEKEL